MVNVRLPIISAYSHSSKAVSACHRKSVIVRHFSSSDRRETGPRRGRKKRRWGGGPWLADARDVTALRLAFSALQFTFAPALWRAVPRRHDTVPVARRCELWAASSPGRSGAAVPPHLLFILCPDRRLTAAASEGRGSPYWRYTESAVFQCHYSQLGVIPVCLAAWKWTNQRLPCHGCRYVLVLVSFSVACCRSRV